MISLLLPNLCGGGAERISLELAHEFLRRGYPVEFVLLRAEGELLAEVSPDIRIVDLKAPRLRHAFWPLVRYLRQRRPMAVCAAMWPLTGLAALARAVSGIDCRMVVSEHTTLSGAPYYRGWSRRLHRMFGKRIYGLCDGVVCVSEGVRQDLIAATGLREARASVIYNPVRTPASEPASCEQALLAWWNGADAKLIAVGSLKPAKDYPNLLQAFTSLRRRRDARLLIVGEGGLRGELEALTASLGIADSVMMPGFVRDPYPYLAEADLFVLSSAWEGLGNVIIEALACGTPAVSTDCPSGPAEILENGKYGRLAPVGNPEALAAAMSEALAASHDREALRRRGAEFSVERAADQYLALLDPDGTIPGAS